MEEEETTSAAEDYQFAKLMQPFSDIPSGGELRFAFCYPDTRSCVFWSLIINLNRAASVNVQGQIVVKRWHKTNIGNAVSPDW